MALHKHFDAPPVAEDFEEDEASGGLGSDSTGKEPKRPSVELDTVKTSDHDNDEGEWTQHEVDGAIVIPVNKIKGKLGMEVRTTKKKGSRILKVLKGGIAEASNLQPKDVIIKINDKSVLGLNHYQVNHSLKSMEIETLTIIRRVL